MNTLLLVIISIFLFSLLLFIIAFALLYKTAKPTLKKLIMSVVGKKICKSIATSNGVQKTTITTITMYSDGRKEESVETKESKSGAAPTGGAAEGMQLGDGDLQLTQCPDALSVEMQNHVKSVFMRYDHDKGGSLDASEVRCMVSELTGREVSANTAMTIIQAMDKNKDGKISLAELLAFWPGIDIYLSQLDTSSDKLQHTSTPASRPPQQQQSDEPPPESKSDSSDKQAASVPGEGGKIMTDIERAVFHELNIARSEPTIYADCIEDEIQYIKDGVVRKPGQIGIMTNEGIPAWEEAAADLRKQTPLPPFRECPLGLYLASKDHCRDQGKTTKTGHGGTDGSQPSDRCNRYGTWRQSCGENISYGCKAARGIVMQLIIDDGVPSRGHRKNIYNRWGVAGVAVGPHKQYGTMCTQNFAGGYSEGKKDAKFKRSLDAAKAANSGAGEAPAVKGAAKPKKGRNTPAAAKKPASSNDVIKAAPQVKVYGRQTCGLCVSMYDALESANVPFLQLDLDKDKSFFQCMTASGFKGGKFGLPVVVFNGDAHWSITDHHSLASEISKTLSDSPGQGEQSPGDSNQELSILKVFTQEGCGACVHMCRLLDSARINYDTYDISKDESYFKPMIDSGFTGGTIGIPIVITKDKAHWSIQNQQQFVEELQQSGDYTKTNETVKGFSGQLSGTFTPDITNKIINQFKEHDINSDGSLGKDEIHGFLDSLYQDLGIEQRPDEIQRKEIVDLFREHDIDRNQKLSTNEIASYLCGSHFSSSVGKKGKKN